MLGDVGHAFVADVSGKSILIGAEATAPFANNAGGQPLIDNRLKFRITNRKKLGTVIEDAMTNATRSESSANTASLVEYHDVMTRRQEGLSGNEAR
jgi:hypothetical protein